MRVVAAVLLMLLAWPSTIVNAQTTAPDGSPSPALASAESADRAVLEGLCQQNAPDAEELSVCLEVVRTYLALDSEPPASPSVPSDEATVKGSGEKTTKAFDLAGGDYLVSFQVKHANPEDSYGLPCVMLANLKNADDRSNAGEIRGGSSGRIWKEASSYVYAVPEGRYYWDFFISSCDWEVTASSTTIDYSEPLPGVVVRSGAGATNTEAFALTGGDYLVSWSAKAGKGSCSPTGSLEDADGGYFGVGSFDASAKKGKKSTGETRLYAVEDGHYYWAVSGFVDPDCRWTVTITSDQ